MHRSTFHDVHPGRSSSGGSTMRNPVWPVSSSVEQEPWNYQWTEKKQIGYCHGNAAPRGARGRTTAKRCCVGTRDSAAAKCCRWLVLLLRKASISASCFEETCLRGARPTNLNGCDRSWTADRSCPAPNTEQQTTSNSRCQLHTGSWYACVDHRSSRSGLVTMLESRTPTCRFQSSMPRELPDSYTVDSRAGALGPDTRDTATINTERPSRDRPRTRWVHSGERRAANGDRNTILDQATRRQCNGWRTDPARSRQNTGFDRSGRLVGWPVARPAVSARTTGHHGISATRRVVTSVWDGRTAYISFIYWQLTRQWCLHSTIGCPPGPPDEDTASTAAVIGRSATPTRYTACARSAVTDSEPPQTCRDVTACVGRPRRS